MESVVLVQRNATVLKAWSVPVEYVNARTPVHSKFIFITYTEFFKRSLKLNLILAIGPLRRVLRKRLVVAHALV